MKKRIYRATHVKNFNVKSLIERVEGRRLVIGVDVAKSIQFAAPMLEDRESLGLFKWDQLSSEENDLAFEMLGRLQGAPSAELRDERLDPADSRSPLLRVEVVRSPRVDLGRGVVHGRDAVDRGVEDPEERGFVAGLESSDVHFHLGRRGTSILTKDSDRTPCSTSRQGASFGFQLRMPPSPDDPCEAMPFACGFVALHSADPQPSAGCRDGR